MVPLAFIAVAAPAAKAVGIQDPFWKTHFTANCTPCALVLEPTIVPASLIARAALAEPPSEGSRVTTMPDEAGFAEAALASKEVGETASEPAHDQITDAERIASCGYRFINLP
jgi:hypothetical protein